MTRIERIDNDAAAANGELSYTRSFCERGAIGYYAGTGEFVVCVHNDTVVQPMVKIKAGKAENFIRALRNMAATTEEGEVEVSVTDVMTGEGMKVEQASVYLHGDGEGYTALYRREIAPLAEALAWFFEEEDKEE
jgi:hypothetical protein